jgi:hypothetical protein
VLNSVICIFTKLSCVLLMTVSLYVGIIVTVRCHSTTNHARLFIWMCRKRKNRADSGCFQGTTCLHFLGIIKCYSFCLMVEASDHRYVVHTRRIHVTRYNVVRVGYILYRVTCIRLVCKTYS